MAKSRVSAAQPGTAFHKDVKQPTPGTQPEFDPARPRKFDLAAFISGASEHVNTRVIHVSGHPQAAAEAERLTGELDKLTDLLAADEDAETTGKPRRLSQKHPHREKAEKIQARLDELHEQLAGTWLAVKLRPLKPSEQDAIRRLNLPVGVELAAAIFATTATIQPATGEDLDEDGWESLTAEEWVALIETIGTVQYLTLDKAHEGLTYQAVTPDFFERFSASRPTRSTSSN